MTTFFALVCAIVAIFGILLPVYNYGMKGYQEAKREGYNPIMQTFLYIFMGYLAGLTIASGFLSLVDYIGFPARYYVCTFLYGNTKTCMSSTSTSCCKVQEWDSHVTCSTKC